MIFHKSHHTSILWENWGEGYFYLPNLRYTIQSMDITFWKGVFMGILIALPTGPVSFIIIRRMYLFGIRSGMYSVAGSMLTDMFYAIVVGFGLRHIQHFLIGIAGYAEVIAGIALCYIGYRAYIEEQIELQKEMQENHPVRDVISIAMLNILNPTLVFSFTTIFLILGMGSAIGHPREIITFLLGISAGTFAFWYAAGRGIVALRDNNRSDMVAKINRITGGILGIAGVLLLLLSIVHIIFPR